MLAFITSRRSAEDPRAFAPEWQRIEHVPVSPGRRRVLHALLALVSSALAWALLGQLDVVVTADGRLGPRTQIKIVQPAEAGVVREILVAEGAFVLAGEPLVRLVPVHQDTRPRQAGSLRGKIWMAEDFDSPDPRVEALFAGEDSL